MNSQQTPYFLPSLVTGSYCKLFSEKIDHVTTEQCCNQETVEPYWGLSHFHLLTHWSWDCFALVHISPMKPQGIKDMFVLWVAKIIPWSKPIKLHATFHHNLVICLCREKLGRIKVLSIKIALATLCSGKLMDKLRCKYCVFQNRINWWLSASKTAVTPVR